MPASPKPQDVSDQTAPSRLYGVIDILRSNRIAGWAIDRADAGAAVEVDVFRDGVRIATVRADRPRADLQKNGLGTGLYGFSTEIDPPVKPGFEFTLTAVARTEDGTSIELKRTGQGASADDPVRRLLESLHLGLRDLARTVEAASPQDIQRLTDVAARLEVAQSQLEKALEKSGPRADLTGLRLLVAFSLAVGLGSLGIGIFSLWQP